MPEATQRPRTPLHQALVATAGMAVFGLIVGLIWGIFDPLMRWVFVAISPLLGIITYLQASGRRRGMAALTLGIGLVTSAFWIYMMTTGRLEPAGVVEIVLFALIITLPLVMTLYGWRSLLHSSSLIRAEQRQQPEVPPFPATRRGVTVKAPDGPHQELFADGSISGEGQLKNGKRHGEWTWYHKNGGLKAVGKYAEGDLDGPWEWTRENGKPLQAGSFRHGLQVGQWKRYYENGQLWDEGSYIDGSKVGEWKVYDKSGNLKQSKTFKPKR